MEIVQQFIRLVVFFNCGVRLVTPKREINIIGFFPTSEGNVGKGVIPAVDLAVAMVNNSTLLKDYELKMYFNDSKCDMAVATKLLFDTLHDRKDNAMLFGDACFEVTGPIAQISKWWNMSQLSYADTNPVLSDRTKYTKLFRVVPSDSDFNPARLALLRHFMWRRVGTIFQDASKGSPRYGYAHNRLVSLLENSTIQVHNPDSFHAETANDVQDSKAHNHPVNRLENFTFQVPITDSFADDPASAVQNLLDRDVRIILGNFSPNMSRRVFCEAYKRNMYGPKYQWIVLGDSQSADWGRRVHQSVSCTEDQLKTAMHGYIATDILPLSSGVEETESQLSPQEYLALYDQKRGDDFSRFHGYAFDGIWVIAKALDKLLREARIDNSDEEWEMVFRTPAMEEALEETNFQGVTGTVKFQNGDRIGMIEIQQFQDGKLVKVGEFQKDGDHLTLEGYHPLIWSGNGPPRDGYLQRSEMQRVNTPIYAALCVLSGMGIIMALVFLTTNIYFRKHRYIKMSSPNMNNIIIVGCIMNYVSVFLLGTDGGLLPSSRFPLMCSARAWVLAVGFTLAFGAMFSKTWRVHAIFTNIKLNKKVIKDYKLFFIVCVLLLLDAVILALWQGIDPLQRSVKNLAPEIVGDVEIIPLIEFCHSKHMTAWMATLYVYKGLLLVFGCFLAWETRQVSIPALNDSKYIGMSVYNVVIMCVCGAAVSFVIKDQPNAAFIIIGLFIIFCTTITLCLVFVPKVVELQRDPEGEDKRVRATLKKPSKRDKNGASDLHERVKILNEENIRYKDILEEKNREIRELLRELGEDVNSFDYSIKSPMHKSVLTLRQKTNPDMSPSKVSRSSAGTEDDNASCYSDSSLTQLYIDSPEHHRHTSYLSRNSNSVTESIELTDIGRKSTTGKLSPIRDSREYIEVDSYDPYSGVYLGPSEPEVTVVENVNYRPPATEEHPIIQRYSGVSFLDECQTGHPGHLSEDSDQEDSGPDNNNSVHSGGSLPGTSPEEEGLLSEQNDVNQYCDSENESESVVKDIDITAADEMEELECEMIGEYSDRQADSPEGEDTELTDDNVPIASPDNSMGEDKSERVDGGLNFSVDTSACNNSPRRYNSLPLVCVSSEDIVTEGLTDRQLNRPADHDSAHSVDVTMDDIAVIVDEQVHRSADKTRLGDDDNQCVEEKDLSGRDSILCHQSDVEYESADSSSDKTSEKDKTSGKNTVIRNYTQVAHGCGVKENDDRNITGEVDNDGKTIADYDGGDHDDDHDDDIINFDILHGDVAASSGTHKVTDVCMDLVREEEGTLGKTRDVAVDTLDLFSSWSGPGCDNGAREKMREVLLFGKKGGAPKVDVARKKEELTVVGAVMNTKDGTEDYPRGAHGHYEEAKEIFITDSLAGSLESKADKPGKAMGDNPLLRPLLSSLKQRKVAPKSKDHKIELEKGSRKFTCDVVEYI